MDHLNASLMPLCLVPSLKKPTIRGGILNMNRTNKRTVKDEFLFYSITCVYFATAALKTCVRKKAPLVFSITCWYTD